MNTQKLIATFVYIVLLAGLFVCPDEAGRTWIRWIFMGLAVAHVLEFVMMQKVMKAAGGSMLHHFLQTLLFGFVHWLPLKRQQG